MKKLVAFMLSVILLLSLSACNGDSGQSDNPSATPSGSSASEPGNTNGSADGQSNQSNDPTSEPGNTDGSADGGSSILIAYFTNPEPDGVDAVARASRVVIDGEVVGNTQYIAQIIGQTTGGDLFQIDTVHTYPSRDGGLMELADEELKKNVRPELTASVENMDSSDIVFLGFPNWWADMPAALYTFLEAYDLSGKTIIPFCPHGGSGFSGTLKKIADLQPNAMMSDKSFSISRDRVANGESDVIAWLKDLGYVE
jgi:flavodoxin